MRLLRLGAAGQRLEVIVLLALVLPILVAGLFVFRMPHDEVAGIVAGHAAMPAFF